MPLLTYDSVSKSQSHTGYTSTWSASAGPPASRARNAHTAARLPPALSPPTATRAGSPPNSAACATVHWSALPAVVERRRKRMLGREPVVDRHDDRARRVGELAGDDVELLDAADHPPAAVEDDEDRQVRFGRRPVHAHGNAVGVAILDREHRLRRAAGHREIQAPTVAASSRRAPRAPSRPGSRSSGRRSPAPADAAARQAVPKDARNARTATSHAPWPAAGTCASRRSRGTGRRRARSRSGTPASCSARRTPRPDRAAGRTRR